MGLCAARTLERHSKPLPAVAGSPEPLMRGPLPVTSPTAVARSVARDAERRARAALDDVLAAHTALHDADTALAAATQAKADAGPALARAVAAARDVGITEAHLAELGITAPSARTLRRHRPRTTPTDRVRPADSPASGQPGNSVADSGTPPEAATSDTPSWPPPDNVGGHSDAHDRGHDAHPEEARPW